MEINCYICEKRLNYQYAHGDFNNCLAIPLSVCCDCLSYLKAKQDMKALYALDINCMKDRSDIYCGR